ncbi:hypothetical protein [Streptomyces sp. CBMA152]|uniref:hypothetical protein n=1 Tax=Streptomyces sp. CBMA152 TaxID=1896312 RepID=UPI00166137AD|nr:hypothetical protein [Streptomyces sp. CBMA152]
MSDRKGSKRQGTSQPQVTIVYDASTTPAEGVVQRPHLVRGWSATDRAVGACRHAGIALSRAVLVPKESAARAANAVRLSRQTLAELAKNDPDPAADARGARNAAAAAAVAAQEARSHGGANKLSEAAHRAAIKASRTAGAAAGSEGMGRNEALNAAADAAEAEAVVAALDAGWM